MRELNPVEWAIRPFKKYAVFSGRAPRAEYWWFYLATMVAGITLGRIDKLAGDSESLSSIFSLATLIPWLAVTVRRLHDTNRSAWWLVILLIAVVAAIAMTVFAYNRYDGTSAAFTAGILLVLVMLGAFVSMLAFMVLPGTKGPNRYGPDPYGPDELEEVFA